MSIRKLTYLAAVLTLASVPLMGMADTTEQFVATQARFEVGLRGSEQDNEKAATEFQALTEQEPGNPLYLAYYGSTFAIKARDALLPWRKIKLGETGLDLIDKGLRKLKPEHDTQTVRGVPLSLETRLVAINTFLQVPDMFFHRFDRARTLLEQTMKSETFINAPNPIRARYYFQAAFIAQKDGRKPEEIALLTKVSELDPQSLDAPAAAKRLKELQR